MELNMNVLSIKGFVSWQFRGILRNPSFYGLAISVLGLVAALAGCPAPWPTIMNVGGALVVLTDLIYTWVKCSYQLYRMEQDRIMRELERKDR
jgi:hypothetical protein